MPGLSAVSEEGAESGRLGAGESRLLLLLFPGRQSFFLWNAWVETTRGVFLLLTRSEESCF